MLEKIWSKEILKFIMTAIIIPCFVKKYNNISVTAHKKVKWDESNEEKKMWLNYFPPLVTMIILEFGFIYVSQEIKGVCLRILIYSGSIIVIFCIEFLISTFWYLNFKNKNEYLSKKHIIHLIFVIDSILLCFLLETNNNVVFFAYISTIIIGTILHMSFIVKFIKNSYKKLKYIKVEFEDGTIEKKIINYEQHKKYLILFINSDQGIIKKTFYEPKIKKKIEIYYND